MTPGDTGASLARARQLVAGGRLPEAERLLQRLAAGRQHREAALAELANLYLGARRPADAVAALEKLTELAPDLPGHAMQLAALLDRLGRTSDAIRQYERLIERRPRLADARFNVALLYKKDKRYRQALDAYEAAARLGIRDVQEVWSNMGVLYSEMRRGGEARAMYERALEVDPEYIPALFNLAGLREERGERDAAIALYRRIRSLDPKHADALSRIVGARRVTRDDDDLVAEVEQAARQEEDDLAREGLWFALGKARDDRREYGKAFEAYRRGNELGKRRLPRYDRDAATRFVSALIGQFDRSWIREHDTGSTAAPVFICGMLRSGSTLVEQILGAHPAVTPGGELDVLPWLFGQHLKPYPEKAHAASVGELERLADAYRSRVAELFPGAGIVTDKRPDNFVHLGPIKALFPAARIVYTRRHPLDNCLSVYFQQLGGNLNYATDLGDIAHYYREHERLMAHWQSSFGADIATVDYDELVRAPEPVVRRLLDFLGVEWDARCLAFHRSSSLVKTASVWQVRDELHGRSSGRWRNYESFLSDIRPLFPDV